MKLPWSEEIKPNNESHYDHIKLVSPIGIFIIEWKGWKDNPSYDITLNNVDWIGCQYDLELAKNIVFDYLTIKYNELDSFLR